MEKSIKSSAINYGLYLGILLSAVTIIGYAVNLEIFTKWWLGIGLLLVIIAFGIVSTAKSKSLLNGFISFKEAFSSYFITVAIGMIISVLVSVVLFNFIDPEAAETLKALIIDSTAKMMERFNAPADAIAETISKMEEQDSQFGIGSQLQSLAMQLVFFSVVGLIVALIMKKANPDAE